MPKKQPAPSSTQRQKFVDAAREAGASEDQDAFDKALKKIASAPAPKSVDQRKKPRAK